MSNPNDPAPDSGDPPAHGTTMTYDGGYLTRVGTGTITTLVYSNTGPPRAGSGPSSDGPGPNDVGPDVVIDPPSDP
jgi:hypothetical protein